jgi:hypothetical protein
MKIMPYEALSTVHLTDAFFGNIKMTATQILDVEAKRLILFILLISWT